MVYTSRTPGTATEASQETMAVAAAATHTQAPVSVVIPGVDSLIGDLLDMDINPPHYQQSYHNQQTTPVPPSNEVDLLGEGLDSLVCRSLFRCQHLLLPWEYYLYSVIFCV